jgi:hypothetical protein
MGSAANPPALFVKEPGDLPVADFPEFDSLDPLGY